MNELIKSIIYLLVGVTVLLVGMRMMSNGMKKTISIKVKNFFKRTAWMQRFVEEKQMLQSH